MRRNALARIKVGPFDIVSIQDMNVSFPPAGMFPNAPADGWAVYRPIYPSAFAGDNLSLSIGAYAIVGAGRTIVVDTGLGPNTIPDNPGQLAANLTAEGIDVADVDTVLFTHLHGDHVGWNFQGGQPTFPRARYVVQQADWEFFSAQKDDASVQAQVLPLEKTGALELVSGETQFTPEITLVPTPGHTPGHQSIIVSSGGTRAFIAGDMAHHPAQAQETGWSPGFDNDAAMAAVTREQFMQRLEKDGSNACFGHYPWPGFGLIVRENGRRIFRAL
jgi:glyoxylase-like metal-dependent hydrolase (beta-lactamase superfamily II)